MVIASLTLVFHLPACHFLKEKRSRLRGLKDKFGTTTNLAISESTFHDQHQQAEWQVIAIGNDRKRLSRQLQRIEEYCHQYIDGYVTRSELEFLN